MVGRIPQTALRAGHGDPEQSLATARMSASSRGMNYNYEVTDAGHQNADLPAVGPARLPAHAAAPVHRQVQRPEHAAGRPLTPGRCPDTTTRSASRAPSGSPPGRHRELLAQPDDVPRSDLRAREELRHHRADDRRVQRQQRRPGRTAAALPGRPHRRPRTTSPTRRSRNPARPYFQDGRILAPAELRVGNAHRLRHHEQRRRGGAVSAESAVPRSAQHQPHPRRLHQPHQSHRAPHHEGRLLPEPQPQGRRTSTSRSARCRSTAR